MRDTQLKIDSLTPQFLKQEGPLLVKFIEYYYEWIKTTDITNQTVADFQQYIDVDQIPDKFLDFLADEFLTDVPSYAEVDRRRLIKNIKDFYVAKGTEKATRLLFRILYDEEIDFYYPKDDILRISDGEWAVEVSLTLFQGVNQVPLIVDDLFEDVNTGAKARINRAEYTTDLGVTYAEVFLSNITGSFNQFDSVTVNGVPAGTITSDGLTTHPGRYLSSDGFLSDIKKIQDGYYYQEYSYEITSGQSKNVFEGPLNNLVHPSGTKLFNKIVINEILDNSDTIEIDFNEEVHKDYELDIYVDETLSSNTEVDITDYKEIDYPTFINFLNITTDSSQLSGLISNFANTSLEKFANVSIAELANVPFSLIGTKFLVYGNPLFANTSPANTSFTTIFRPGSKFSLDGSVYYAITAVYSDDVLALESVYPLSDFYDEPFYGINSSNIIDNEIDILTANSQIVLGFSNTTYTYFGLDEPENWVFKNYSGARNPVNVGVSNSFNIPVENGNYNVTYTYANSGTYFVYATVDDEAYAFDTVAKGSNVNSIVLDKTDYYANTAPAAPVLGAEDTGFAVDFAMRDALIRWPSNLSGQYSGAPENIVTYTRSTGGGRFNELGNYEWVSDSNVIRYTHDPATKSLSSSNCTIAVQQVTLTTDGAYSFVPGTVVQATSAANTSKYMRGRVVSYNSGTNSLVIDSKIVGSAGSSASDWVIIQALGYLPEPQRTNLVTNSNSFSGGSGMSSAVSGAAIGRDGTASMTLITENTSASAEHYTGDHVASVTVGTTYVWAFDVRNYAVHPRLAYIRVAGAGNSANRIFDPSTGQWFNAGGGSSYLDSGIIDLGGGLYRIWMSFTATGTGSTVFRVQLHDGTSSVYTGDGVSGLYVGACQAELGSYPTSYIATTTSTVTRAADVMSVALSTLPFSATAGTIGITAYDPGSGSPSAFTGLSLDDETSSNALGRYRNGSSGTRSWATITGGAAQVSIAGPTAVLGHLDRSMIAWATNDSQSVDDSTPSSVDSSVTLPTGLTKLHIGGRYDGAEQWSQPISNVLYIPRRLTQAEMIARTS